MSIKKLSKVIGLAFVSILFAGSVLAMGDKKNEMIQSLGLDANQQTQVEKIMTDSHAKRMGIMNDPKYANMNRQEKINAMHEPLKKLHEDTQAQLAKVLNTEQMEKLMEMQDEMKMKAEAKMNQMNKK